MSANLDNGVMLGALGSTYNRSATVVKPPTGMIIAAIQCIGPQVFTTLTAENPDKFYNIAHAANDNPNSISPAANATQTVDEGSGGTIFNPNEVPAGVTLYGRWTAVANTNTTLGGYICYFGY